MLRERIGMKWFLRSFSTCTPQHKLRRLLPTIHLIKLDTLILTNKYEQCVVKPRSYLHKLLSIALQSDKLSSGCIQRGSSVSYYSSGIASRRAISVVSTLKHQNPQASLTGTYYSTLKPRWVRVATMLVTRCAGEHSGG